MIPVAFNNIEFQFMETPTAGYLINEIFKDNYRIFERGLKFEPGDVILDVGANEGVFSILMAKLYPDIRVLAFEPVPKTFYTMINNIKINGVLNIYPYNIGLSGGGKKRDVIYCDKTYSGGSSMVVTPNPETQDIVNIDVVSLDDIFDVRRFPFVDRIKLMKMDIEGAEYEVLYNSTVLPRIDNVVAEFHMNERLERMGYDMNELATWVGSKTNLIYFEKMRMAE